MKYYSQKDPKWSNEKLGTSTTTIGQAGCKITCIGMFAEKTPSEVNKILKEKNAYVDGCLSVDESSAKAIELNFNGRVYKKPNCDCIAETDYYKKLGFPQHFFVLLKNGKRIDPLDLNPSPEVNDYPIVSYRLFEAKAATSVIDTTTDTTPANSTTTNTTPTNTTPTNNNNNPTTDTNNNPVNNNTDTTQDEVTPVGFKFFIDAILGFLKKVFGTK